jgi:uncharacterized protein (TIGR00251 family)
MNSTPWQLKNQTLILDCYVQPGASRTRLSGIHDQRIKIQLQAPPVDGKANQMLIKYLAKLCCRPKSSVSISRGLNQRRKTVCIDDISQVPRALLELGTE